MIYSFKKSYIYKKVLFFTLASIAGLSTSLFNALPSVAVTAAEWRPDQIVDDMVFYNGNDMSIEQIQAFLNSKVPSCDTWGTKTSELGGPDIDHNGRVTRAEWGASRGYASPYICLRDYYENPATHQNNLQTNIIPQGAISAANIIKNAAQNYGISARALLVMIQKESPGPLITDEWPLANQYRNALGFGCPDTAPCNPEYEGFSNQINNAAQQFIKYKNSPNSYRHKAGQNNNVLYNPNYSCGSSPVYIKTRATAGLYNYTPYQPNGPALANLYGSGDACSAYGNRNFWRIFRDWFGSTTLYYGTRSSVSTAYATSQCTIQPFSDVARLYNPDSSDYLLTVSRDEACGAVKLGYIWDGVVLKNQLPQSDTVPIYRLRYASSHIYAVSNEERANLISKGFSDEGILTYGFSASGPGRIPVYRLGQESTYVLTSAGAEGTYFVNSIGQPSRGIGFYTLQLGTSSHTYRLRKGVDRLYTVSQAELSSALSIGYQREDDAGIVDSYPGIYSLPVYRLSGPTGRLYTFSRVERDLAVINYGFFSEGIGFYSFTGDLSSVRAIYRSTNYYNLSRLYTPNLIESNDSRTYYGFISEGIAWYTY